MGRLEGKTPLEKPSSKREDNIKINLKEIGSKGVEWIRLAQDRDKWKTPGSTATIL
jgi:hypothetical protein